MSERLNELYVVALDADGTVWTNAFPEIGEVKEEHANVAQYIRNLHAAGATICLWTCRVDVPGKRQYLEEAVQRCKELDIPLDYVNDGPNTPGFELWKPRKIFAHEYIDDRAVNAGLFKDPKYANQRLKEIKAGGK